MWSAASKLLSSAVHPSPSKRISVENPDIAKHSSVQAWVQSVTPDAQPESEFLQGAHHVEEDGEAPAPVPATISGRSSPLSSGAFRTSRPSHQEPSRFSPTRATGPGPPGQQRSSVGEVQRMSGLPVRMSPANSKLQSVQFQELTSAAQRRLSPPITLPAGVVNPQQGGKNGLPSRKRIGQRLIKPTASVDMPALETLTSVQGDIMQPSYAGIHALPPALRSAAVQQPGIASPTVSLPSGLARQSFRITSQGLETATLLQPAPSPQPTEPAPHSPGVRERGRVMFKDDAEVGYAGGSVRASAELDAGALISKRSKSYSAGSSLKRAVDLESPMQGFRKVVHMALPESRPHDKHSDAHEGEEVMSPTARFRGVTLGIQMIQSLKHMVNSSFKSHDIGDEKGIPAAQSFGSRMFSRMRGSFIGSRGSIMGAKKILINSSRFETKDRDAGLLLLHAVKRGDYDGACRALEAAADPDVDEPGLNGMTPLHFVASCGRAACHHTERYSEEDAQKLAELLLRYNARQTCPDKMGFLPMHLAAYHGNLPVLQVLLADMNKARGMGRLLKQQDWQIKYTPLHCAVDGEQTAAVIELLLHGSSYKVQDATCLTPWILCATHHREWGLDLVNDLNLALASNKHLPADAVLQLALELRTLEVVPVVLKAAAKWPAQIWQLMRASIAAGLEEFVELLAQDIPEVCPAAFLEVPWEDVMVELATRFPKSLKTLLLGLNIVDFEGIVKPFMRGLNFDGEVQDEDEDEHDDLGSLFSQGTGLPSPATSHGNSQAGSRRAMFKQDSRDSHSSHGSTASDALMQLSSFKARAKSMLSLRSMLAVGKRSSFKHRPSDSHSNLAIDRTLPEAVKYLLLRCLVSALPDLEWHVFQHLISGMSRSLFLEVARFPKLFKRLTESIATRYLPEWDAYQVLSERAQDPLSVADAAADLNPWELPEAHHSTPADHEFISAAYNKHVHIDVNHVLAAAIDSRSSVNVYNIVTALDKWLANNPQGYIFHLDPSSVEALAADYPDACKLLFSFEAQGQTDIKVPGYLFKHNRKEVCRCANLSSSFIWHDDGLLILRSLGITDLTQVQGWIFKDVTFDAVLKLFQASSGWYPSHVAASYLDQLLAAGLTGKDVNKLVQLDNNLKNVVDALEGGLPAEFIHQMIAKKISFQVVTEMLDMQVSRSTQWNNVRHQSVWSKFPKETWRHGITYEFIRIFFETWEECRFDKRFIDLVFDFHDPLFVKLRTALEYVNSNKAMTGSFVGRLSAVETARKSRALSAISSTSFAFRYQQRLNPYRAVIVGFVYVFTHIMEYASGGVHSTDRTSSNRYSMFIEQDHGDGHRSSSDLRQRQQQHSQQDESQEAPKVDAVSETLPLSGLGMPGDGCYLRALLRAKSPADMYGLPAIESLISVKWYAYGYLFMLLLLGEHLVSLCMTITYLVLVTSTQNGVCGSIDPSSLEDVELADLAACPAGVAILVLDGCLLVMAVFPLLVHHRQVKTLEWRMWAGQPSNAASVLATLLQITTACAHLARTPDLLQACVALLVLLQFMRLGWFSIINEKMGALVRIIAQTLADTMYFLLILAMLFGGFALALYTLAPQVGGQADADPTVQPMNGGYLALKLFSIMLGDISADFLQDSVLGTFRLPGLSLILMLAYLVLVLVIAFNMLVAIMNSTFNRISDSERNELLKLKARALVDIEAGLPRHLLDMLYRDLMGKYLHVLHLKDLSNASQMATMAGPEGSMAGSEMGGARSDAGTSWAADRLSTAHSIMHDNTHHHNINHHLGGTGILRSRPASASQRSVQSQSVYAGTPLAGIGGGVKARPRSAYKSILALQPRKSTSRVPSRVGSFNMKSAKSASNAASVKSGGEPSARAQSITGQSHRGPAAPQEPDASGPSQIVGPTVTFGVDRQYDDVPKNNFTAFAAAGGLDRDSDTHNLPPVAAKADSAHQVSFDVGISDRDHDRATRASLPANRALTRVMTRFKGVAPVPAGLVTRASQRHVSNLDRPSDEVVLNSDTSNAVEAAQVVRSAYSDSSAAKRRQSSSRASRQPSRSVLFDDGHESEDSQADDDHQQHDKRSLGASSKQKSAEQIVSLAKRRVTRMITERRTMGRALATATFLTPAEALLQDEPDLLLEEGIQEVNDEGNGMDEDDESEASWHEDELLIKPSVTRPTGFNASLNKRQTLNTSLRLNTRPSEGSVTSSTRRMTMHAAHVGAGNNNNGENTRHDRHVSMQEAARRGPAGQAQQHSDASDSDGERDSSMQLVRSTRVQHVGDGSRPSPKRVQVARFAAQQLLDSFGTERDSEEQREGEAGTQHGKSTQQQAQSGQVSSSVLAEASAGSKNSTIGKPPKAPKVISFDGAADGNKRGARPKAAEQRAKQFEGSLKQRDSMGSETELPDYGDEPGDGYDSQDELTLPRGR